MRATTVFLAIIGLASKVWAAPMSTNETASVASVGKRWAKGSCGVHVRLVVSHAKKMYFTTVKIYDGAQIYISTADWGVPTDDAPFQGAVDGLGYPLHVRVLAHKDHLVQFAYDKDVWGSGNENQKNDRCSVGKRASDFTVETIDMDCGFSC